MLPHAEPLSEPELRQVIEAARGAGELLYSSRLFEKLVKHGVSIQDLLYICQHWELIRTTRWAHGEWRYRIEGPTLDGKWMAAVVSVKTSTSVVVITGFRFARGKKKR